MTLDMLQTFDVEGYLYKVENLMNQEHKNAELWLQGDTREKMEKIFVNEFVTRASNKLKEKEGGHFINHFEEKNKRVLS